MRIPEVVRFLKMGATPLGLIANTCVYPGLKQPWALRRNRFAVKTKKDELKTDPTINRLRSVVWRRPIT